MLQLLDDYKDQSVKGWLMSEKFDGVRAYWNGFQFLTRNNNIINVPRWFCESMPNEWLDGELWLGRGKFEQTSAAVRQGFKNELWANMIFKVFDLPLTPGNFSSRLEQLNKLTLPTHCQQVEQRTVDNKECLNDYYTNLLSNGAEGVVIKSPSSPYNIGRTSNALKYVPENSGEAKVIGINRHDDLSFKSLKCLFNNEQFNLSAGISEQIKTIPPKIGKLITIKFNGLTGNNLPRHAVFITTRDYE